MAWMSWLCGLWPKRLSPVPAPDGDYKIVFSHLTGDGSRDLYVVNPDGSGLQNLTQTPDVDDGGAATWSPDATRIVQGRPAELRNVFSDFREVGGIVFPHRIESSSPDRPRTITIVVESIELDPVIDPARFRFPD